MSRGIAVVGMGCRYPDADSPESLWESVLARRRAFRRMPAVRMSIDDYFDSERSAPDRTYSAQAAVLRDWTFDRHRFRIAARTYASADTTHWLALETADAALADARMLDDVERGRVAVIIGNTLTGDRTRANAMRGRWPFVARVVDATLAEEGLGSEQRRALLERIESRYKGPFDEVEENTLAGALSNTIAGRICNHFGFGGGGYTVDGACASSLLAIADACALLEANDVDAVVAGGVDLSLDPFELVGFAKTAALAAEEMFVYDRRANGFLPGEGCGMVVLMRAADARAAGRRIYATIRGWGISSDGHGGLTRPESAGQSKALRRAYARAGFSIDSVTSFEGHGTGTPVGDAVEIDTLIAELRAVGATPGAGLIGSVKANIGHTKAAAGVAGFIKAALTVHHGVVPPATACDEPIDALTETMSPLRIAREPLPWPTGRPRRAAVSAMGFGGINAHVVLEAEGPPRRGLTSYEAMLDASAQDAELLLFSAPSSADLAARVAAVAARAPEMSLSELGDLAVTLARRARAERFRAALVVSKPNELAIAARRLIESIETNRATVNARMAFAEARRFPRLVFLFSGQAAPLVRGPGEWQRRFPELRPGDLWTDERFGHAAAAGGTAFAQPAIVTASICALRVLDRLGIHAEAAVGHSLGEISALCWGGALDEAAALDIAFARGSAMQPLRGGRMAALACGAETALHWLAGHDVVLAAVNSPRQCVISGSAGAVDHVVARARNEQVEAAFLPVDAAFHTNAMAAAAPALRDALRRCRRAPLSGRVISTVSGTVLPADADVVELAVTQLTRPVLFDEALRHVADADLLIEVGPGHTLAAIAPHVVAAPAVSVDACSRSLAGLLGAAGAAFAVGVDIDRDVLFRSRFARPYDLSRPPSFIENPCEAAPPVAVPRPMTVAEPTVLAAAEVDLEPEQALREVIAARVDLPIDLITPESLLLRDLHLNSITVAHLLGEVAQRLGLPPLGAPTQFANASVAEAARALGDLRRTGGTAPAAPEIPAGVAEWARTFAIERIPEPLPRAHTPQRAPMVVSLIGCDAAMSFARLRDAATQLRAGDTLVVVQERPRGGAFARTLYLERPDVNVCVVNADSVDGALVAVEAASVDGFREVFYDGGERFVPRLALIEVAPANPLHENDVLLVSGGGKGIAAESALHLARRSGTAIGIIGRSDPAVDEELDANLTRFRRHGVRFHYASADVTDAAACARAVAEIRDVLGPIAAVMHGAGTNAPALIAELDEAQFRAAFAPKVDGLRNLLACCDGKTLRLVVAFGSVIARSGMRGEAHYAFANEWLAAAMDEFAAAHPRCRALTIEWSVWSGAGMGERLGRVEALRRDGITPIGVDDAVAILESLVASDARGSVVVAGRLGALPTLSLREPRLPLLRFLEQPRIAVDEIEIVADAELTAASDPYLREHVFRGDALVPAVVALEAMAQAASALRPLRLPLAFDGVDFRWPIVAADRGTTMRIAALASGDTVDVVVRASSTQFTTDHFRARLLAETAAAETQRLPVPAMPLPLDVERDIYDALLFHRGRFRRIRSYRTLTACDCVAEIEARPESWFAPYRPLTLLLGDPAVRDAAIHALQACVPHATVLPSAVESIHLLRPLPENGSVFVHAHERERTADHFVYDLALTDADGTPLERWRGLRLQVVEQRPAFDLAPILWGPLLERLLEELVEVPVRVTIDRDLTRPHAGGSTLRVMRRPDGKPDAGGVTTSTTHAAGLTLSASSQYGLACDLEPIIERGDEEWATLLGPALLPLARAIAARTGEDFAASATRVWTAHECTQKRHGVAAGAITLARSDTAGIVTLSSGANRITTFVLGDAAGQRFACGFLVDFVPPAAAALWKERRTS